VSPFAATAEAIVAVAVVAAEDDETLVMRRGS